MIKTKIFCQDKYEAQKLASLIFVKEGKETFITEILDVFDNEPNPSIHICMHNAISLTPHIGAATLEAQERIGTELAKQIATHFKK